MSIKFVSPVAKTFCESLLPNQKIGMHWFKDKKNFEKKVYEKMALLSDFDHFYKNLTLEGPVGIKPVTMTSNPAGLSFLQFIIRQKKVKNVLEVGTFLGVSAMFLAESVKKNKGRVVTIEIGQEFVNYAQKNFKRNGHRNIDVLHGDAKEIIKGLPIKDFQFLFIDGDKTHYLEIFLLLEKRVSKDCIIVFDDVIFNGDIFNDTPNTKHGLGVKNFLAYLKKNDGWIKTLMPISNGMLLLEKKA